MRAAASALIVAYGAMMIAVGAVGIVSARWELKAIFSLDPALLGETAAATLLNQYRFLKGVEFGAGLFCLTLRKSILAGDKVAIPFLALVTGGVVARTIAWAWDGQPSWPFIVFLLLEALVLVVTLSYLVRRHAE